MVREEYPRPQMRRENWCNLNGEWGFAFDDADAGLREQWFQRAEPFTRHITVPFVYEAPLSGIDTREQHDVVWYRREFATPKVGADSCVLLHFGAVDYEAQVFLNGVRVATHEGGETPFTVDIAPFLTAGDTQVLTVRVHDPLAAQDIPRGKQFWGREPIGIWYTRSTGIWQTVWYEVVERAHISQIVFTPDVDAGLVEIALQLAGVPQAAGSRVTYKISYHGELVAQGEKALVAKGASELRWQVDLGQGDIFRTGFHGGQEYLWSPEFPNLFDVELALVCDANASADAEAGTEVGTGAGGKMAASAEAGTKASASAGDKASAAPVDFVRSYFGMRKIHAERGMIYLNNKPYYQKLVLDQGYWPQGLLTAPDDAAFRRDIELAKAMGFNGCRKHQKLEDPRFLYWADKLGYLVWEECGAAPAFSVAAQQRMIRTWTDIIERDMSHPCIVVWVPLNESWGVPQIHTDRRQQHYSQALYHLIHGMDPTRLVESNDGWDQTETDICAIHNYAHGERADDGQFREFQEAIGSTAALVHRSQTGRPAYAPGFAHQGAPIVLSEFGGIALAGGQSAGWGYTRAQDGQELVSEYERVTSAVLASRGLWGFCYTQLTDVEQEINGLLTYTREPKCDLQEIRRINDKRHTMWIVNDEK